MALTFEPTYYLTQRSDVFQAYVATAGSTGLSWAQYAEQHYNNHGRFEGSNPNAIFNTLEYLTANPDVAAAGINPFQHYLAFGANEGRAPSASFPTFASFDEATYLAANADLAAAGITTKEQAYAHFVIYGQFEGRPGAPDVGTTNPGEVIALKTEIEVAQGGTGDDTFTGVVSSEPLLQTLSSGDAIIGGAGKDTLRVTVSSAAAGGAIVADLNSIENLEIRAFANQTFNLSTSTGLEAVSLTGTNDAALTGLKNIVSATVTETTAADLTLTYDAAVVAGTADVQKVTVSNASTAFAAQGIETFEVTAAGKANALTLTSAQAKTVKVSGSADIVVGGVGGTVTTFDASAATGKVSTSFTAAKDVTVTGGTGDDTFGFAGFLTKADVVDGGEGFDTVIVTGNDFTNAAQKAQLDGLNALKSIERVQFNTDATTINGATFKNSALTHVQFNTVGNDKFLNASSDLVYEIGTANTGTLALELQGTGTVANITLKGNEGSIAAGDGVAANVGNVSVVLSGGAKTATTINLVSEGSDFVAGAGGAANSVGVVTANSGSTVVVTGTGALDVAGSTNNIKIDASALTGKFTVEGSEAAGPDLGDIGNSKTDLTNTGVDTITLGSAQDKVTFNSALDSGIVVVGDGAFAATGDILHDTIVGFTAGANGDVLEWTTVAGVDAYAALTATVQANINALSGAGATLYAAANLATNATADATWTAFSFQGTTYAVYNAGGAGGDFTSADDLLVGLTGVSVADLTAANFA
ncbi:MAG: hypothetical protein KBG72_03915 [Agrobacterium sp.]|nr:hypothetical protein [Agrobacterium sp.]